MRGAGRRAAAEPAPLWEVPFFAPAGDARAAADRVGSARTEATAGSQLRGAPVILSLSATPTDGVAPLEVSFSVEDYDPDGDPPGAPRLRLGVKPKSKAVPKRRRQVAFRVVLRNAGSADADGAGLREAQAQAARGQGEDMPQRERAGRRPQRRAVRLQGQARGGRQALPGAVRGERPGHRQTLRDGRAQDSPLGRLATGAGAPGLRGRARSA